MKTTEDMLKRVAESSIQYAHNLGRAILLDLKADGPVYVDDTHAVNTFLLEAMLTIYTTSALLSSFARSVMEKVYGKEQITMLFERVDVLAMTASEAFEIIMGDKDDTSSDPTKAN